MKNYKRPAASPVESASELPFQTVFPLRAECDVDYSELSWVARGIMTHVLAGSRSRRHTISSLAFETRRSKAAISRGLGELMHFGLVVPEEVRGYGQILLFREAFVVRIRHPKIGQAYEEGAK